jgi:hypothetical protein
MDIVKSLFPPGSIGNLNKNREQIFGMANIANKIVVIGRDMPADLSKTLPQEYMQVMASGEDMEVPRKGQEALQITWTAPVIMGSNHMPDYINTGNNVGRRMVSFRFDRPVMNPKEDLLDNILSHELPNIVCRILRAYHTQRSKVKEIGCGFWQSVPPQILEWQRVLAAATNKLHAFLAMDDEDRGCIIKRDVGKVTLLEDFKKAFEDTMKCEFKSDLSIMARFGFRLSENKVNICKGCCQISKGGQNVCCIAYSTNNRYKKFIIYDMSITPLSTVEDS